MDPVDFLEQLVAIPSLSGEENATAAFLIEQMAEIGLQAHRDAAGNAVGVLGDPEARRRIVLLGHMDTVPGWIPVRRAGDLLYGRGSVDAKGPLAAFVQAVARLDAPPPDICVFVIGATGEEAHSPGAHYLAQTFPAPECAIIGEPSSWNAVTLGYKGVLSLEYSLRLAGGHSASGQTTPAEEACAFWDKIVAYSAEFNHGDSWRFATLDPSLRDIHTSSDGLEDSVTMSIRLRTPPELDFEELKARICGWAGAATVEFPYADPAVRSEKNTPLVRAFLTAIRASGDKPRFKLKTGSADMNVVGPAWGCPIVAYGPGDSTLDHTPEEHIEIAEYLRAIDVLEVVLRRLTGLDE